MRILFVHEVNWLRKVVYEVHDYPELLSVRGHEVVIIDFPEDEPRSGFRRLIDLKTELRVGQSRAHRESSVEVRTPGRVFPPPFDRVAASITQVPAIWRALRDGEFDVVVLYGVPTNGWHTVRIARHFGVPVLFRAIDISHLLRRSIFNPLIEKAERSVYKRADWVSTHNVGLRDYAISQGADAESISIDVPGIDLDRFAPGPRDPELAARLGIRSGDRVILFMGTFYRFAGLLWLLDALTEKMRQVPNLKLLLVGGGEEEAALRGLTREYGLDEQVIFAGWAEYDDLADFLRLADVAVNPFEPERVTDCALPGKVLQYLACGIPTVSTPLAGLRGALPDGQGVVYGQLGDGFLRHVSRLLDDESYRVGVAEAGRAAMKRRFRWEQSVEQFESAIEHVRSIAR